MLKILTALVIAGVFLLSSCLNLSGVYKKEGDAAMERLIAALTNQDKTEVKSMFSEKALSEAEDFDNHLDYLFDFFEGAVLSWKQMGSSIFEEKEGKHNVKNAYVWYKVTTDQEEYLFIFIECLVDAEEPQNVGLYMLRVIRAEDKEREFSSWEGIEIPGIYKPEIIK